MNNYINTKNSKYLGSSLIELVLYMGLMSIFILVLMNMFTTTLDTKLNSESVGSVNRDSRYILSKLIYILQNSEDVISPAYGTTSDTLHVVHNGQDIQVASSSGKMVLTNGAESHSLNSLDTDLVNISFTNTGKPGGKSTIKVDYVLKSNINSKSDSLRSVSTAVSLR